MHQALLSMLIVLAVPTLGMAETVQGDATATADVASAAWSGTPHNLDLRIDPSAVPPQAPGPDASALEPRQERYTSAAPQTDDRGLFLGVELKPQRPANSLARNAEADQPGLRDDVERLIEHSTLSLRGSYRF